MVRERTGMFMQDHSNINFEQLKLMLEPHPYTARDKQCPPKHHLKKKKFSLIWLYQVKALKLFKK